VAARRRLQVERPELVHADDHVGVAFLDVVGSSINPYRCKMRFFLASSRDRCSASRS
jgi:hypothetical protein